MRRGAAVLVAIGLLLGACVRDGSAATLEVYAAASLTEVVTELGRRFERAHPGVTVRFSFAGSPSLVRQVADGAPADVLITADEATLEPLVTRGDVLAARPVARNRVGLLVAAGNPKGIRSVADLARRDVTFVQCAPRVPCGALATAALSGVGAAPRSLEANVKAVVARVLLGEADAGLVYETDVLAAGSRAEGVPLPEAPTTVYRAAVVRTSGASRHATAWLDHLSGTEGQATFARFGFLLP